MIITIAEPLWLSLLNFSIEMTFLYITGVLDPKCLPCKGVLRRVSSRLNLDRISNKKNNNFVTTKTGPRPTYSWKHHQQEHQPSHNWLKTETFKRVKEKVGYYLTQKEEQWKQVKREEPAFLQWKKVKQGEGIYTPSLTYEQVSLPSKIESKTSWMEIFEDCKWPWQLKKEK